MLSVVSVRGGAWPQQPMPVTRPPVVSAIKPSAALERDSGGPAAAAGEPALEGTWLTKSVAFSALPPVDPTQQSEQTDMYNNAAAPEKNGLLPPEALQAQARQDAALRGQQPAGLGPDATRSAQEQATYPGQLPEPYKTPQERAEEERINNFLSNVWQASRAVVDAWQSVAPAAAQETSDTLSATDSLGDKGATTATDPSGVAMALATTDPKAPKSDKPLTDPGAAARDAVIKNATASYANTQRWPNTDPPAPGTQFSAEI